MIGQRIQVRWESASEQGISTFIIQPLEAHPSPYGIEVGRSKHGKSILLPLDPHRVETTTDPHVPYTYRDTLITFWQPKDPQVG